MRKAVIDLGTNTFSLLVADVVNDQLEVIHSERIPVLLGMGGINQGILAEDAFSRGIAALRSFRATCDELKVERIIGFGTSALRAASNSKEFTSKVELELGFEIRIITGMQEAQLIYEGVKWLYDFNDPAVIMDIGGGSTEFISADHNGLKEAISLDIGVSRIYQLLKKPVEYTDKDRETIRSAFEEESNSLLKLKGPKILIGASGSFETFYEMIFEKAYQPKPSLDDLPIDKLREAIDWSISANHTERENNQWIMPNRKSMLPIGALKVKWVMELLGIEKVYLSPYSLKEGGFNY
jgi:exopolyphosphatase/guanosine-5'-triphosphate,3'-diphosphate pyrophosphatase